MYSAKFLRSLSDNDLWRAFDISREEYGPHDKRTEKIANTLYERGWDPYADEYEPSAEDYREWCAASCGLDYIPLY